MSLPTQPHAPRRGPAAFFWLAVALLTSLGLATAQTGLPDDTARIHYQRADGLYDGWELHVWEDTVESVTWADGLDVTGVDEYGAYWDVRLADGASRLGFIVHRGDLKDPGPDMFLLTQQHGYEIWLASGSDVIHTAPPLGPPAEDVARIHYLNPQGDYADWVLHVWEDTLESVTWERGLPVSGTTPDGIYWEVRLAEGAERVGFIVHRGDEKDPGPDMFLSVADHGREVWMVSGSPQIHNTRPDLAKVGGGDLSTSKAHWIEPGLLLWRTGVPLAGESFALYSSPEAGAALEDADLVGWEASFELTVDPAGVPAVVAQRFPHLAGHTALRLPDEHHAAVPYLLTTQLTVARLLDGKVTDATGVQLPGVLDSLYAAAAGDAPLGVTWQEGIPSLAVWAPTARSVGLRLYQDSQTEAFETFPLQRDDASGVWSLTGDESWRGRYYLYEVEVYAPSVRQLVTNLVTDPYSVSLSLNSRRSQVIDLADPALAPAGWEALVKPTMADPVDITIYELHVRDFSAADASVPEELIGKYLAFTAEGTLGVDHLRALARAGLTHLHLLPTFDIATIDEDPTSWSGGEPDVELPYAGPEAQAFVESIRDTDAFNWGYDPLHYNVPEGSYALYPDGPSRVLEYRQMVMALWDMGLRVVADVVYNHTNAAGQAERSVLDRIVPGYYHRLDDNGHVATSTCCQNTATEHAMMRRLMVDSVALWAEHYKIDAFRFDLMGHHMVPDMLAVRAALDALKPDEHGTHGEAIYLYGEGWDFGEVALGARGPNATQSNLAGTGIGTFNDRLRDAVRGGGPFDDAIATVGNQGFASGRYWLPNAATQRYDREAERLGLLRAMDQVRVGLAGNLAAFVFEGADGDQISGADVDYNGSPAGYGEVPQDHIVYVSKHDNQTLWDILAYKLPSDLPTADRVRLQNVALSLVAFSQGVPFFHAGSDLLRSKSFDRNSYDSGDWFNAIDWTGGASGRGSGMGRGLPRAADNQDMWSVIRPLLTNPALLPTADDAAFATAVFQEWLSIRRDESLLRLRTAEDIAARLTFHNTGPEQVPGVIVMQLRDDLPDLSDLSAGTDRLLIVFNATPQRASVSVPEAAGLPWLLHEVQAGGVDAETLRGAYVTSANGRVTVPPFSTAVFKAPSLGR